MKKIQWVQIVSNALPNKYQNIGCMIFAMGRCCIKIGQQTHIECIGLIQSYQAFFLWQKGIKLLSASFQEIGSSQILGYLWVSFSFSNQFFNDYLRI